MKNLLFVFLMMTSQICFGQITFQKTYGGTDSEHAISVEQTADNGYIIAGYTYSFGAGNEDVYLLKTNELGDTLWTKTYGGFGNDAGFCIRETSDGGYVLLAKTWGFGAGNADIYLIKINSLGDTLWTKTYGGAADDNGFSIEQMSDSGYIVIGYTYSFGAGNWIFRAS